MSNSRQIASLPNILTLIDDAGGQFIKQQAAGVTTSYTITWPSAVGSSGAVLALTDGSGGLGWQSTLGIALSGGTVNNSVIGGSTPAAITGTTITANTAFVGPLTGNSTTATALAAGRTFAFTGDATGTSASFDGSANVSTSLTLAASGVSANSYGSATAIPVITVDSKGRITAATTAAISSSLTIGADNGSNDTVTIGTDTLNFVGTGSEIETTVSNNQIQIGLPSTVSGLTTVSATNLQGALAGTIASTTTGATQAASDNSTKIATTAYVTTALANLVDSAPGALNTLNELAAALGDDANFSTTVTNSIATKLALAGGTMTGNLILGDNVKALFGTGSDLEIYHDGSNSYIVDAGTGGILYRGGTQTFQNAAGSKTMAVLNGATSVDLYYDNSKKFETTAAGVTITGTGTATTFSATTLTGTLSTAAQPNVTSVGTLSALTVSGNLNATLTTAAQTNITSVGTLTGLTVNGTANATTFVGALTGNVTGNVSGSAATVTGAAQTNITSLGTLSALTVSGDVTIDTSTLKVDTSNNRVGILNALPDVTLDIGSATDSIHIPVGTTAQRPGSPAAGYFRYNSSLSQFEGYTSAWGAIGGGGTNTFNHNVFTGDGSTTAFALAAATESENNLLVFIDGVFQEQGAYSIATSGGTTTLTMSAAPASGRKLVVYQVSAGVSGNNLNIDTMTGDGSDTTLTLSINPVNENNVQVFFDGVYQNKSTFSVSGTTLTFSTAPPTGVEVEAMTFTQTEINVPVDNTVTAAKLTANSVTTAKILDDNVTAAKLEHSINLVGNPTTTTQTAGDNSTKIATTAYADTASANAAAAVVDSAPGTLDTLNELASALGDDPNFATTVTNNIAGKLPLAGGTLTGDINFGDNDKAIFGAGSDLQIYHDVTDSYISDQGSGNLKLLTDEFRLRNAADGAHMLTGSQGGAITAYHNGSAKLATTSTGIDVTGAVTADGLTVDGNVTINSTTLKISGNFPQLLFEDTAGSDVDAYIVNNANGLFIGKTNSPSVSNDIVSIDLSTGNVGIGTSSPFGPLNVHSASGDANLYVTTGNTAASTNIFFGDSGNSTIGRIVYDHSGNYMNFRTNGSDAMRIDAGGSVLIGKNTPTDLHNTWNHLIIGEKGAIISENGAGGIDGITLADNVYIDADTGSYAYQTTAAASQITQSSGVITFSNAASGSAGAALTPVERMRIDSSGRVGIGNSIPSSFDAAGDNLVVGTGSGNNGLTVYSGTANAGSLFFADGTGSAAAKADGYIQYTHSDQALAFATGGGSERMRINSNGGVEVTTSGVQMKAPLIQATNGNVSSYTGTTPSMHSPASATLAFSMGGAERMRIDSNGTAIFRGGTTNNAIQIWENNSEIARIGGSSGTLNFLVGSTTESRMAITSTGNVGIGTTDTNSHRAAIDSGAGTSLGLMHKSSNSFSLMTFKASGTTQDIRLGVTGNDLLFQTNATERMRIDSNGNVGIGTGSAAIIGRLEIAGNSSTTLSSLALYNSNTATAAAHALNFTLQRVGSVVKQSAAQIIAGKEQSWTTTPSTVDGYMAFHTTLNEASTERMRIDSSGRLLVGKTDAGDYVTGFEVQPAGAVLAYRTSGVASIFGRTDDGEITRFTRNSQIVGNITVSSGTVSYNPFMGSHYSETNDTNLLFGTVMEATGNLVEDQYAPQARLSKTKISDVSESSAVYGVWIAPMENGGETIAALGASWCRINSSETVALGDLLTSNGDGTAKVQSDDIIRSKTIGKVTSTTIKETHADGSYVVPVVLYCG